MSISAEYHEIMLRIKELETKFEQIERQLGTLETKFDSHRDQDRGFGFRNWELLVMAFMAIIAGIIGAFFNRIFG